jgi:hypothetical protein
LPCLVVLSGSNSREYVRLVNFERKLPKKQDFLKSAHQSKINHTTI